MEKNRKYYYTNSQVKFLPETIYEGMQVNLYNNKVLFLVWREEPAVITIDDPKVYQTFKTYFDTLWNQDTLTYRGDSGIKTAFQNLVDELNPGEEVHIMGVYDFGDEFLPLALFFQKIRSEKGIKAKFLINEKAKNIAKKFKDYPPIEMKFLSENLFTPAIFLIYSDKVIINLPKEKSFFVIKNKATKESFDTYFNMLWNST